MQTEYPKAYPCPSWDSLNVLYPVKKFPNTDVSSKSIGHLWRSQPEVLKHFRPVLDEAKAHTNDFNVVSGLTRSQTCEDFGLKIPETKKFSKHTSCTENEYIYPLLKRVTDHPPQCRVHGTTEMRSAFVKPSVAPRLTTEKNQFKNPILLPGNNYQEPSFCKELPALDTTYDGYEKYLDPYLTTSRLHFRPHTAEQLSKPTNNKDIITYYTYADVPWTRTPKPKTDNRNLPLGTAKPVFDKAKFKQGFREIRVPNKLNWVPGSFRTETRDNYTPQDKIKAKIPDFAEEVKVFRNNETSKMEINDMVEQASIENTYFTENQHYGTGKPVYSVIDQFRERNKRLEKKLSRLA